MDNDLRNCIFLSAAFILAMLVVNPVGNFPLNDDFNYGETALTLARTGQVVFPDLPSPTMIFQVFWGAAFAKLFGLTYTALRVSTIVMALVAILSTYFLMRELGFSGTKSIGAGFVLAFNPLFFSLSSTFMTDVHFLAMMIASCFFYVKGFKNSGLKWLFLGSLFAVFAFLVRQNGAFIPLAAAAYSVIKQRKVVFKELAVVFAFPIFLILAYSYWYAFVFGPTRAVSGMLSQTLGLVWLPYVPFRIFTIFLYLGLFLIPLSFAMCHKNLDRSKFIAIIGTFFISALGLFLLKKLYGLSFPQLPNILHLSGLGPAYMQGIKTPDISFALFVASIAALASASYLFGMLLLSVGRLFRDFSIRWFVYFVFAMQAGFILILGSYFDRYVLPLLVFAIALVFFELRSLSFKPFAFGICIFIVAMFSVAATQDYMAWNRARLESVQFLQSIGAKDINIDAGYEFDCSKFCSYSRTSGINNSKSYDPVWIKDSATAVDSRYVVSFYPLPNYKQIRTFDYFSMLTLRKEKIYALERT